MSLPARHDAKASSAWEAATLRRTACPLYRWIRPSRCSRSTGFPGRFQWIRRWHQGWKSSRSCPIDVLASTKGRNGLLNAARTASCLTCSPSSVRIWPKRRENTVRTRSSSRSTLPPDTPRSARKNCPWTTGTRRVHHLVELAGALRGGLVGAGVLGPRLLVPQHAPLLVQHRLQGCPAGSAEPRDASRPTRPAPRLPDQLAQQRNHRRPLEEAPERLGDERPQPAAGVIPDARRGALQVEEQDASLPSGFHQL